VLLAEIHGKTIQAARDSEDYLTSTVFGHLRYVPPHLFWPALLATARSVPGPGGTETSLYSTLTSSGIGPARYERLEARFWKSHPALGEPDLLLLFAGGPQPPLVVLIEAKLWSGKSGVEENDQLVRYLGVLDDLDAVGLGVPPEACRFLVYLTPRESFAEVEESLAWSEAPERDRGRLFRLRWQDVLEAARRSAAQAPEPARTILADVATFLGRLGLEYFAGFSRVSGMPMLTEKEGAIFRGRRASDTSLLTRLRELGPITTRRASWAT
jgi:hypothetical protein